MKLGEAVQINVGVSDLGRSLAFYENLGFTQVDQSRQPYLWALLSDGQHRVLLIKMAIFILGWAIFRPMPPSA